MRALIKMAPGVGNLALMETDVATPGPGEALVRIQRSGLCGTDLLVFDDVYRGRKRPVPYPLVLGHEASGEVVELGAGATGPAPGTPVAIEAVRGCGACFHCVRGNYNLCQDWHHIGLTIAGALADYLVIPATSLLPLPASVSLDDAADRLSGDVQQRLRRWGRVPVREDGREIVAGPVLGGPLLGHVAVWRVLEPEVGCGRDGHRPLLT